MSTQDAPAVDADVSLDGATATVPVGEHRVFDLNELFHDVTADELDADARRSLCRDDAGWDGFELCDCDHLLVNESALSGGFGSVRRVGRVYLEGGVRDYIEDREAGAARILVRGVTPPGVPNP